MIELKDVTKKYPMGEQTVAALDGVSLRVDDGEFVAIVGPSGSGKSTLMNIIGCLDVPDTGSYTLDDKLIEKTSDNQLAYVRNTRIGFIFQGFNLLAKLSALENVELPLIYQKTSGRERRRRALQALEQVGLQDRVRHKPNELSGGQQQRVAIARAIAGNPSLILADEPTGNLDSKSGKDIMNLLQEMHRAGNTLVLITHDPHIAAQAKRQIYIEDGKITREEVTSA